MSRVRLISTTSGIGELSGKSGEEIIAYAARVSNPKGQDDFQTAQKLLKYCIKHGHWSVFELANLTLEINTSRAIAAQILRHRSFSFQEFSQRYAEVDQLTTSVEVYEARRQDTKNRQNSIDDLSEDTKLWFEDAQKDLADRALFLYHEALGRGIAKEQARFLLPLSTATRLYMTGNVRSWIHYINLRTENGTQKEHAEIAKECKLLFCEIFPNVAKAMEWIQ